jgi:hypothetical protein
MSLQEWGGVYVTRCYREGGIRKKARSADMEMRKERIYMVALIALAVVMLIWAIVTWDEPAEKPAPKRHRHV